MSRMWTQNGLRAFTLFEVILVLVLLGIFGGLVIVNFDTLLREDPRDRLERVFWAAVEEARLQALYERQPVELYHDRENDRILLRRGGESREFPLGFDHLPGNRRPQLTFWQSLPADSYALFRSQLVDTRPIDSVVFYPDGTCTDFGVDFRWDDLRKTIKVDPWTGRQLLEQSG